MATKDVVGLLLTPVAVAMVAVITSLSQRARDAVFFLLVMGLLVSTQLDINFLSAEWYRGTTRGIEVSFVDILALALVISSVLFPRAGHARFYWPASLGLILLFLLYCLFSVMISQPKIYGWFELSKLVRALICFLAAALYVQSERELRLLIFALACALLYEGGLALKQRYLEGVHRVTGSLDHPNSLSTYLLLVAPVMVAALNAKLPRRLLVTAAAAIGAATAGEVLTASRMGLPAFGLVMLGATLACMSWRITKRKIATALALLLVTAFVVVKSWDTITSRFGEASLAEEYEDPEKENRGHYLRLALAVVEDRFFGVGLNNWSYWISKEYGPKLGFPYEDYDDLPKSLIQSPTEFDWALKYAPPAHNLAAITAGELGVPGLLLFGLLWARWLWMGARFLWPRTPDPMRQIAIGVLFGMFGVLLQSLTEWVFRQTGIILTFHLLIGALAGLCYRKRLARRQARQQHWEAEPTRVRIEPPELAPAPQPRVAT